MVAASSAEQTVLDSADRLAREVLAPRAAATDAAPRLPADLLKRLAESRLLGLSTPREHGGIGASATTIRRGLEIVASGCGTTAFVYFQHIVACRHIAGGENAELAGRLLPALASGSRFCTLAFSHLRRPGPPMLRVAREGDTFVFDGTAPWATGAGLADDLLLAGTTAGGDSIWVVVPLVEGSGLSISPPMQLSAANASATVSLRCEGLRVSSDAFVKRVSPERLAAETAAAILFFSALSLGVACAAARVVESRTAKVPALAHVAPRLWNEIEQARCAVDACAERTGEPGFDAEAVEARAWCIDLGIRAAHAAVTASGGAANLLDAPAQRLLREAMLYTLTAQTLDLRAASLARTLGHSVD